MANKFGAKQVNSASVATSTTTATLAVARPTRHRLIVKNTDDTDSVHINMGGDATTSHMTIAAGESITVTGVGEWDVIAAANTPAVDIIDEYD